MSAVLQGQPGGRWHALGTSSPNISLGLAPPGFRGREGHRETGTHSGPARMGPVGGRRAAESGRAFVSCLESSPHPPPAHPVPG